MKKKILVVDIGGIKRQIDDLASGQTKIQIRAELDAARDRGGDETIGQRLEIRRDLARDSRRPCATGAS